MEDSLPEPSSTPPWKWLGDERSSNDIEDEIAEELRFHLDQMSKANQQSGLPTEEAKRLAQQNFGDFKSILAKCKQIQTWERIMLQRIQVGLISLLILLLGLSYFNSRGLSYQLGSVQSQLEEFKESVIAPKADAETMEILVVDENDQPMPEVQVTIKWGDTARNHYDLYQKKTDEKGRVIIARDDTVHITTISAEAPNYASNGIRLSQSVNDYLEPQLIRLMPSIKQTLLILNNDNNPLKMTSVSLLSTWNPSDYSKNKYRTNEEGEITIDLFAVGDKATIRTSIASNEPNSGMIQYDGQLIVTKKSENEMTTVRCTHRVDNSFGGGGGVF